MAQKLDGRVAYADLLRSFATLAVIVLHLAGSQLGSVSVGSPDWDVFNLYDGLVRWCVPVFVMLSGMFLLDPKRSLPLPKLLFHNALRIFIALLFWGGIYALAELWEAGKPFSWDSVQSHHPGAPGVCPGRGTGRFSLALPPLLSLCLPAAHRLPALAQRHRRPPGLV